MERGRMSKNRIIEYYRMHFYHLPLLAFGKLGTSVAQWDRPSPRFSFFFLICPFVGSQVKGLCGKCSAKHRTILAKTTDPTMISWFTDLKDGNPQEYAKVLSAAEPKAGQRYSKFNLTAYHEQHVGRKVRGQREDQEAMVWARYLQFHTEEITDPDDRMTPLECRASWLRDLQGPDAEKREFWSKKRQKWEERDVVWVTIGGPKRYKKKEEEESRSVQRTHTTQSGADSVAAAAYSRMQNFVSMEGNPVKW